MSDSPAACGGQECFCNRTYKHTFMTKCSVQWKKSMIRLANKLSS